MKQRLHDYLATRKEGATAEELLDLLFAGPGTDTDFGRGFLRRLLADDPRFEEQPGNDRWQLADEHLLEMPVAEAPFVVVDLETTGHRLVDAGITEIGAIRLQGGVEQARFETLVNPRRPISPYVVRLTGITDAMVADAPGIEEVIDGFVAFAEESVVVAHNAAFDVGFLDHECRRILGRPLGLPSLCTLKLTGRLLPRLRRTSVDALAMFFGFSGGARHRAMSDVEMTVKILMRLLAMLEERGLRNVGDLLEAQDDRAAAGAVEIRVSRASIDRLTESAGVYELCNGRGEALFVGRAENLRQDVAQEFLSLVSATERKRKMLCSTVKIDSEEAGSPLEMALLEARRIRERKPVYNRPSRHLPRCYFVKISRGTPFPRVFVTTRIIGDHALYLGPLRGRKFAEEAKTLLGRLFCLRTCAGRLQPDPSFQACPLASARACSSPCDATVDRASYARQVEQLEQVLAGDGSTLRSLALRLSRQGAEASRVDAVLGRLLRLHRRRHWLVNRQHYIAFAPAARGAVLAVLVVSGCVRRVQRVRDVAQVEEMGEALDQAPQRRRMSAYESDASTIMAHWVRYRKGDGEGMVIELRQHDLKGSLDGAMTELEPVLTGLG